MTPEEIRIQTSTLIRGQQGLSADPSSWSYEQRVAYNKAYADYILANPSLFNANSIEVANHVRTAIYSPLADTSVASDLSQFGTEFTNNLVDAGNSVGGIGRGVLAAAKWSAFLIPGGLIIVAGIYLYGFYLKQKRP